MGEIGSMENVAIFLKLLQFFYEWDLSKIPAKDFTSIDFT